MDPVHIFMDPVHGPGPWRGSMDQGSMFCTFPTGKYELNKLTSLPTCGFIAQLVEHRTGIAEVTGSNPVEALIFSGFFFPIA